MDRLYEVVIEDHLAANKQMVFIAGPRQVGKTTLVKKLLDKREGSVYLNWDVPEDRRKIIGFFSKSEPFVDLDTARPNKPTIAFDEIHKFDEWKNFLKGYYDLYKDEVSIIVTGSAKLNVYKKGGDSLMGRYFLYRMHPLSLGEILGGVGGGLTISKPRKVTKEEVDRLLTMGGFPDPYVRNESSFLNQWSGLRFDQLFKDEIRDLSRIYDIGQIELMGRLLEGQSGQLLNYTSLSKKVLVSVNTVRAWFHLLEQMYFCFKVKPWHRNVSKALIKEPKVYLWDWSRVKDPGARIENFVASHLLKAVHYWNDTGLGEYDLFFIRDRYKREVDFLLTKDDEPWVMLEVKTSAKESLSPHLFYFKEQVKPKHVLQIEYDMEYVNADFREFEKPMRVSMATFLSQLI